MTTNPSKPTMTPEKRKLVTTIICIACGTLFFIVHIVITTIPAASHGFSGSAATGRGLRGAFVGVAGMGFGIILAWLFLPKATVSCPNCQDVNAKPKTRDFVSGTWLANKCEKCGHEWQ
jgi:hypothetical protein